MTKIKKIFKIIFVIFLVIILLGSCSSPASAYADTTPTEFIMTTSTRFGKWVVEIEQSLFARKKTWKRGSFFADVLAVDSSGGSSSVTVSPVYCLQGKIRLEYTNGNYEIVTTSIQISSKYNPITGSVYSGIPNYTSSDFGRTNDNIPTSGTWFFIRQAFDSSGNEISDSCFCFNFDDMPLVTIFNNGEYGFTPVTASGRYYADNGSVSSLSMNINTVRFLVRSTNSIVARTGLDWSSRYEDYRFITTDFSLTSYYASVAFSNNSDFTNTVNQRLDTNNYGINFKMPVIKCGIDARTIINNDNVNNYTQYFSYDNGTIIYNYNDYEDYFLRHDEPIIKSGIDNIYNNQPAPLEPFSSSNRYNYVSLVEQPETNLYLPESWLASYPPIATNPNLDIVLTTVPHLSLPAEYISGGAELVEVGFDFYNAVPELLGVVLFFGVAGILIHKLL